MLSLERAEEVRTQVREPAGDPVDVSVERSGFVHWQYEASNGGWELVLAATCAVINVLSHDVLWRRGWLIRVEAGSPRAGCCSCRTARGETR